MLSSANNEHNRGFRVNAEQRQLLESYKTELDEIISLDDSQMTEAHMDKANDLIRSINRIADHLNIDMRALQSNAAQVVTRTFDIHDQIAGYERYQGLIDLHMSEVVFIHPESLTPRVSACGAGPCLLMSVRDNETGRGFVTHIYCSPEIDPSYPSGRKLLKNFQSMLNSADSAASDSSQPNNRIKHITVHLAGGWRCYSNYMIKSARSWVTEMQQQTNSHVELNECLQGSLCTNALVDFTTGEVFEHEIGKDLRQRYERRDEPALSGFKSMANWALPCFFGLKTIGDGPIPANQSDHMHYD